tara:strand:+ start:713 stop:1435 length:723 start_codon:yes stop_codon:yes gene_type:complete
MYFNKFKKIPYEVNGDGIKRDLVNLATFTNITTKLEDNITFYSYYTIKDGDRPDNVAHELYDDASLYWILFLVNPTLRNIYADWPRGSSDILELVKAKHPTYTGIVNFNDSLVSKFQLEEVVVGQLSGATGIIETKNVTDGYITIKVLSGTFHVNGEAVRGVTSEDSVACDAIVESAYGPMYYTDNFTGDRVPRRSAGTSPVTRYDAAQEKNLKRSRIRVIKKEFIPEVVREFNREMRAK